MWLAAIALVGLAAAGQASSQRERFFQASPGQTIVVGLHPSIKDDCSRGPLVEIVLGDAPSHGAMTVDTGWIALEDFGDCPIIEGTTRRVLYRASLAFTGEDRFTYRTTDYAGRVRLHVIRVDVKRRGARDMQVPF